MKNKIKKLLKIITENAIAFGFGILVFGGITAVIAAGSTWNFSVKSATDNSLAFGEYNALVNRATVWAPGSTYVLFDPPSTITGGINMQTKGKIANLVDPTALQDAATKNYVDSIFTSNNCVESSPNEFDKAMGVICVNGWMAGIKSVHRNDYDDRQYTVKCCSPAGVTPQVTQCTNSQTGVDCNPQGW